MHGSNLICRSMAVLRLSTLVAVGIILACGVCIAEVKKQTYTYKRVHDLQIKADVYREDDDARRAVVVWIHGGALINGHREGVSGRLNQAFLDAGCIVVSIDYRLAPETELPEIIEDIEDAFRWIREKGPELFNADPDRLAVVGGSAGGYLTLTAGFRVKPRPDALVALWGYGDLVGAWYSSPSPHPCHHRTKLSREEAFRQVDGPPIADARDRKGNGGAFYQFCRQQGLWPKAVSGWDPHAEQEKFAPYMPVKNVTGDYPPTLMVHGQKDTDVPHEQSVMMAAELRRNHVEHKLISVPNGEHGLAGADRQAVDDAYRAAIAFVRRHLEKKASGTSRRIVVPLDGTWSVGESVGAEEVPASFGHSVAVPGLTNQAKPPFPDVDQYETHEYVWTMKLYKVFPESTKNEGLGRTRQKRNYFWYNRTFTVPRKEQSAVLVINKAQFGTAVWLNGKKVGQHWGCSTAARFDVTQAMNWAGENRLVVRVGAHPGVVPEWVPLVNDGEKEKWTPGIYDNVSLLLGSSPLIETLQVAPRIDKSEIAVQTRLKNLGPACSFDMVYRVKTWRTNRAVGQPVSRRVELGAGEEKVVTHTVPVPGAILWSPDNPFLYVLDASTGGDSFSTRFGMREFRCDSSTGRAVLNGKVIYLRGSSITLHRFFGDAKCGNLPWDETWVRKFLVDMTKRMHWNAFRVCIGPAPQRWLDIADEAGLLLQYEFPIWSDREPLRHKNWKPEEVMEEFREFVRDNWNHPSVVIWDASNETRYDFLREKVIPAVRAMDLSNRPWDNGYNKPQDPNDPCEHHPYLFGGKFDFDMPGLDRLTVGKVPVASPFPPHAAIINEYDWLWLHRDGTPTFISKRNYDRILGPKATPAECIEFNAYALAGLTEFWRASRKFAGVLYYGCLDGDRPVTCVTCDNFRDIQRLEFHVPFEHYVGQAFKPLGVYIHFWQPDLSAGVERSYRVTLINDTYESAKGRLELTWEPEGGGPAAGRTEITFAVPALGQSIYELPLATPTREGKYLLKANAFWEGKPWSPTVARRKVLVKGAR